MKVTKSLKKASALLFAGALSLMSITSPVAAQTKDANADTLETGYTYEVPVSLGNKIPMPPVSNAIKDGSFAKPAVITVHEDGSETVRITLQTIEIDMSSMNMGIYYANITELITNEGNVYGGTETAAKIITTREAVKNSMSDPTKVETNVPEVMEFTMPKTAEGSYEADLLIYYSNDFMGTHSQGTLSFDYANAKRIADTTVLENKIEEAKKVNGEGYTTESYAALQQVVKEAEALNASASKEDLSNMVKNIQAALDGLKKITETKPDTKPEQPDTDHTGSTVLDKDNLKDGYYSVQINLWHATSDKASMANDSFDKTAFIEVKDGIATMIVSTHEMSFGTIKATLQTMKVEQNNSFVEASITGKNTKGDPTGFRFPLPHTEEYINVYVNPMVAMMGNQDIAARIKVDYTTLKAVDSTHAETPIDTNKNTTNTDNNIIKNTSAQNSTDSTGMIGMLVSLLGAGVYLTRRMSLLG